MANVRVEELEPRDTRNTRKIKTSLEFHKLAAAINNPLHSRKFFPFRVFRVFRGSLFRFHIRASFHVFEHGFPVGAEEGWVFEAVEGVAAVGAIEAEGGGDNFFLVPTGFGQ